MILLIESLWKLANWSDTIKKEPSHQEKSKLLSNCCCLANWLSTLFQREPKPSQSSHQFKRKILCSSFVLFLKMVYFNYFKFQKPLKNIIFFISLHPTATFFIFFLPFKKIRKITKFKFLWKKFQISIKPPNFFYFGI